MDQITFQSLISGFIGAIIGGLFTLLAATYSVRKAAEKALELEKEKKKLHVLAETADAINALNIETDESLASITEWKKAHGNKMRFSIDAWVMYKKLIPTLDKPLQKALITVYNKITRHNTTIDYDLRVPFGLGSKDSQIKDGVGSLETSLLKLKELLINNLTP